MIVQEIVEIFKQGLTNGYRQREIKNRLAQFNSARRVSKDGHWNQPEALRLEEARLRDELASLERGHIDLFNRLAGEGIEVGK